MTLQWNSPILTDHLYPEHQMKYSLQYNKSSDPKVEAKKLLSLGDLTFNNELATYTIHKLTSNTSYQFKLVVVSELGSVGKYARIEGGYAEITVFTSKMYTHVLMYVIYVATYIEPCNQAIANYIPFTAGLLGAHKQCYKMLSNDSGKDELLRNHILKQSL